MEMKFDLQVDAKGLACPMPVVKAKKGMDTLSEGQVMMLETTDKGAVSDFSSWVERMKYELMKSEEADGVYRFFVKK